MVRVSFRFRMRRGPIAHLQFLGISISVRVIIMILCFTSHPFASGYRGRAQRSLIDCNM